MGLIGKVCASIVRRGLTLTDPSRWASGGGLSHAGEEVSTTTALNLSAVWACVNLLAGTVASLPIGVFRTTTDGSRVPARDHWAYALLHDSPNGDQTAFDFWSYLITSLELRGSALARKVRIGSRVVALQPVNPEGCDIRRDSTGDIRYRWSEAGTAYDLGSADILHVRGFPGTPLGGWSTLSVARHMFGLAIAIDKAAGKTFQNGLRPSVALLFDKFLTDPQRKIAEEKLASKYAGAVNAGRPFIGEGGVKLETISLNPEDAQMLESRGFSVEEICRWFGIPPHMVGHMTKATSWGTGLEQQVLGFVKFSLGPRLKRIEAAVMKQLLTPADRAAGVIVEFNVEGLLRGDSAARAAFYQSALRNRWMVPNEVRALENRPPVAWGDDPFPVQGAAPDAGIGHNGGPPLDEQGPTP